MVLFHQQCTATWFTYLQRLGYWVLCAKKNSPLELLVLVKVMTKAKKMEYYGYVLDEVTRVSKKEKF